jgi:hypothetical protein
MPFMLFLSLIIQKLPSMPESPHLQTFSKKITQPLQQNPKKLNPQVGLNHSAPQESPF